MLWCLQVRCHAVLTLSIVFFAWHQQAIYADKRSLQGSTEHKE